MRVEVLLPQTQHFLQARLVGADGAVGRGHVELRAQQRRQRLVAVGERRREAIVGEAAVALFGDEARLLQETQMPRNARLRQPEDAGELGDVQPLARQDAQQPQPRLVAEQAVEGRRMSHIYKSTCVDWSWQDGPKPPARQRQRSSIERGQSSFSRRDSERSASRRPPVWHVAQ